jgi:hypothetical protein
VGDSVFQGSPLHGNTLGTFGVLKIPRPKGHESSNLSRPMEPLEVIRGVLHLKALALSSVFLFLEAESCSFYPNSGSGKVSTDTRHIVNNDEHPQDQLVIEV